MDRQICRVQIGWGTTCTWVNDHPARHDQNQDKTDKNEEYIRLFVHPSPILGKSAGGVNGGRGGTRTPDFLRVRKTL